MSAPSGAAADADEPERFRSLVSGSGLNADERFKLLAAAWQKIGASGLLMLPKYRYLHTSVEEWQRFEPKWRGGDQDVGELTGNEISARMVLQTFRDDGKKDLDGKPFDPASVPGGELDEATTTLRAFTTADEGARSLQHTAADAVTAIPLEYKVAGAATLALLLVIALRPR
jgi:hypothetical protein